MKKGLLFVLLALTSCFKSFETLDPNRGIYFSEQPRLTSACASSLEFRFRLNALATVYYVTVPSGAVAPGAEEVLSGKAAGGTKPLVAAWYRTGVNGETRGSVLPGAGVNYDVYIVAKPRQGMTLLRTAAYKLSGKGTGTYTYRTKWGTNGSAPEQLSQPRGLFTDAEGNVYVADMGNSKIKKFDSSGNFLYMWGTSGSGVDQLNSVQGWICSDPTGNYIYVADLGNSRVKKFDVYGNHITNCGSGYFNLLWGVCTDPQGNVYTTDLIFANVCKFDSNLNYITSWGSSGSGDGQFNSPHSICSDPNGYIYVADSGNDRIQKFDSSGNFIAKWGTTGTGDGQFSSPEGVCLDAAGNIYVMDSANFRVQKFDSNWNLLAKWGSFGTGDGQFGSLDGVCVDASGNVYVSSVGSYDRVQAFH